jgi:hypothetical protein
MVCRGFEVLHRFGIRFAEHDREHGVDVVRVRRSSLAGIKVGRNRVVADIGKAPGDVADVLDEPESLVDHHDAWIPPALARLGEISLDRLAAAFDIDRLAAHAAGVGHCTGDVRHAIPP